MAKLGQAIFALFLLTVVGFGVRAIYKQRAAVAKTREWVEQFGKQIEQPFIHMSGGKNLAIAFKGFDFQNERHAATVQAICEKGSAAIKPATLFYSNFPDGMEGAIAFRPKPNGVDIIKSGFDPGPFWAMDQKCAGIVTITVEGEKFRLSFDPVHYEKSVNSDKSD